MTEELLIRLDPRFPFEDVESIGRFLEAAGALTPGYGPPNVGMLDVFGIVYAQDVEGQEIVLLPDRNIVSRLARVAKHGGRRPLDYPTEVAVKVMAFCQAMNIMIEPSVAFHELAHREGNTVAWDELSWFRVADTGGQADVWIDVALGRRERLAVASPCPQATLDLAHPLGRWRRNYVVALKIAALELSSASPVERAVALIDWMFNDYFMAGPAAVFATMYFAPQSRKKRLIKHLRSADREKALDGIKNAAWDMTHLSDFAKRVMGSDAEGRRYIFATADKGLRSIAPMLMIDAAEGELPSAMEAMLLDWWPATDATLVARALASRILAVADRPAPAGPPEMKDPITSWIEEGEKLIRSYNV